MTDKEMIRQALVEYEENHWEQEGMVWQAQINRLLAEYGAGNYDNSYITKLYAMWYKKHANDLDTDYETFMRKVEDYLKNEE